MEEKILFKNVKFQTLKNILLNLLLLFIIVSFISTISIIRIANAKNCGGDVKCSCGDTLVKSYVMDSDLVNCTNGLNIGASSVTLNCNGHTFANIKYDAVKVNGRNNVVIENCNFRNSNYGIYTSRRTYYIQGIFDVIREYAYNINLVIKNNTFYKNNHAIYLNYDSSTIITKNTFKNNSQSIFSKNVHTIKIYNNTFYRKNIFLSDTANKYYCVNGYSNNYINFNWSNCSCFYPYSNLLVNSKVDICPGTYYNIKNIYFNRGTFNCNNKAKFIGARNSYFALVKGTSHSTIEDCDIENYSRAIFMDMNEIGYNKYYPYDIKIIHDTFINNYIGIQHQYDRSTVVYDSTFRNNTYDFYRTSSSYSINYGKNILGDDFVNTKTSGSNFCYKNYRNIFLKDKKIKCHCITPYSGMVIDSNVVFCPGTYHIDKTIVIKNHNIKINCNNTILVGNKRESGFKIYGYRNVKITNCIIENFSTGISFNYDYFPNRYAGYYKSNSYGNVLINNTFFNNNLDINVPQNNIGVLKFNNFLSFRKLSNLNYGLDISNNYWGTNNFTLINRSFGNKKVLKNIITINNTNVSIGKIYLCTNKETKNISLCVNIVKNNYYPINNLSVALIFIFKNDSRSMIKKNINNFILKKKILHFPIKTINFNKIKVVIYGNYNDTNLEDNYKVENIKDLKLFSFDFNKLSFYDKIKFNSIKSLLNLDRLNFTIQNIIFNNNILSENKLVIHPDKNKLNFRVNKNSDSYFWVLSKVFEVNKSLFNISNLFKTLNNDRRIIMGNYDIKYYKFKLFNRTYQIKEYKPVKDYAKNEAVVLAGGLWSDINTWRDLARRIANYEGIDTYLIELTGGKYETDNSYDYKYSDLINKVLPAYFKEIKNISNKSNFIYIGHSNGARVMVDFLNRKDLIKNLSINISKVFLVAPPGNFSNMTYFPKYMFGCGEMLARMDDFNQTHITFSQVISYTHLPRSDDISDLYYLLHMFHHNKISKNLFAMYCYIIFKKGDRTPFFVNKNVNAYFIGGDINNYSDLVVPKRDVIAIYNSSIAKRKSIKFFKIFHSFFENSDTLQTYILPKLLSN